jgi:hypothetical protein
MSIILLDYIDNVAISLPSQKECAKCAKRLSFLGNSAGWRRGMPLEVAKVFGSVPQLFRDKVEGRARNAARHSRNQWICLMATLTFSATLAGNGA